MCSVAFRMCPLILFWCIITWPVWARSPKLSLSQLPFFTVWNAPTQSCGSLYGVDLDLSIFDIIHNQNQTFTGNNITIFYSDKLGLYPYYTKLNESVNGGVPQNSSLNDHLCQAKADLQKNIPDEDFQGLAVIDWENWRPLWDRNWDTKEIYRKGSRTLVRAKHPDWGPEQIEAQSVKDFEGAARAFMEDTLKLGRDKRPSGLWGYYGFPDCYNYQYKKNSTYRGECPPMEVKRNNKMAWLWDISSALYPNIYLDLSLKGRGRDILLYTKYRIMEAMRIGQQVSQIHPVIIPYARIVYTFSLEFLSQEDLVHTIGESVALGSAGVVLWGDASYSKNKSTCTTVKDYIDNILGRYMVNVTAAAALCSETLCSSHGRCVRSDPHSSAYLHLDPVMWTIIPRAKFPDLTTNTPSYVIRMKVGGTVERTNYEEQFKCQCFTGFEGDHCQKQVAHKPG
ncbi:hyaluronidase-1 [Trichomycterus rosablanca]|uniref:hyaluronidase-1 n=1 Tax=Trichomycterus rosablanca TaxID=2290929 RepID=UPI002F356777